jgi:triphosphoribosyl-dephospho-CoA synthase
VHMIPMLENDSRLPPLCARRNHALAALAEQALIAEAELTPKPGLVDRRGSGAHSDLSLQLMRLSATSLRPFFAAMGAISTGRDLDISLRRDLAAIGRDAERKMYQVTGGVNTHKGAIWNLGLLVAAAARSDVTHSGEIAADAGTIARLPDRPQPALITHGDMVRKRYGINAGARAEAASGFPHVLESGLVTLRIVRAAKFPEEICRLDALLSLMSEVDDTCVLYRGGGDALSVVKSRAQAVLLAGGCATAEGRRRMRKLDQELIARHASPGGSADLLAATIFLDAVERQSEIRRDHSRWEKQDGAS